MIYGPKSDGTYVVGPIGLKKGRLTETPLAPGTIGGLRRAGLRGTAMNGQIAKLRESRRACYRMVT